MTVYVCSVFWTWERIWIILVESCACRHSAVIEMHSWSTSLGITSDWFSNQLLCGVLCSVSSRGNGGSSECWWADSVSLRGGVSAFGEAYYSCVFMCLINLQQIFEHVICALLGNSSLTCTCFSFVIFFHLCIWAPIFADNSYQAKRSTGAVIWFLSCGLGPLMVH